MKELPALRLLTCVNNCTDPGSSQTTRDCSKDTDWTDCECNLVQCTSVARRATATAEGRIHNRITHTHTHTSRASLKDKPSLTSCRPASGTQGTFVYTSDTAK